VSCAASGHEHLAARGRRDLLVGREDPAEVQGVGCGDEDRSDRAVLLAAAHCAQERHGLREGVLLAVEARDETAAPDFAAGFELAAGARDLAPGDRLLLPLERLAEDDSGASQQAAGDRLGSRLTAIGRETLAGYPDVRVDYFAVVDANEMKPVDAASADSVAIVAARVGPTRLIDNMILGEAE